MLLFFDGHNDCLLRLRLAQLADSTSIKAQAERFLSGRGKGHLDLPRALEGGLGGGFFALFVPTQENRATSKKAFPSIKLRKTRPLAPLERLDPDRAFAETIEMLRLAGEIVQHSEGRVQLVLGPEDLRLQAQPIRMLLHLEGAEAVRPDLANLEELRAMGVRSIGPVWSRPNAFGHGVPFAFDHSPDTGPGLTVAGKQLLAQCEQRGIALDLSHLNQRGFFDVAAASQRPLMVTHTASHALAPSTRNLTDAQIDAVGATAGVIGINLHCPDLRADGKWRTDTPLTRWAEHAAYVAERIGAEHVAVGSDFDGALMPAELQDAARLPALRDALRTAGFHSQEIEGIAGQNWLRILRHHLTPLEAS